MAKKLLLTWTQHNTWRVMLPEKHTGMDMANAIQEAIHTSGVDRCMNIDPESIRFEVIEE